MRRDPHDEHPAVTTAVCARGCTIRGNHRTDCPDQDTCNGCQPRPATHGTLCAWDWQRLHADIVDTPHLVRHLRTHGYPDAGRNPDAQHHGGDPAYRIPYPHEWATADELANALVGWVRVIIEEHPAHLVGPDLRGIWWTRQTLRVHYGEPHIEPPRPAGIRHTDTIDEAVRWVLPHLQWAAQQPWIVDMREDLATQVGTARARWPENERGHAVQGIPCPRCDQLTLWYDPPTRPRPTMQAVCTNPECGRIYTEDEWARLRELVNIAHNRKLLA